MKRLEFSTFIPGNPVEIWDFFSSPRNLSRITPPGMNFRITSTLAESMYEGMLITYKVAPVAGFRMTWVTEITKIREHEYFIDEQRLGPYKIWHHEHHFRTMDGGIEMKDILIYHVGKGLLGKLADKLFVKKRILAIFRFREQKIREIFF